MDKLKPYRVMWRPDLSTRWLLMKEADTREEADGIAVETIKAHRGYVRLITQHVIEETTSAGATWEAAPSAA